MSMISVSHIARVESLYTKNGGLFKWYQEVDLGGSWSGSWEVDKGYLRGRRFSEGYRAWTHGGGRDHSENNGLSRPGYRHGRMTRHCNFTTLWSQLSRFLGTRLHIYMGWLSLIIWCTYIRHIYLYNSYRRHCLSLFNLFSSTVHYSLHTSIILRDFFHPCHFGISPFLVFYFRYTIKNTRIFI